MRAPPVVADPDPTPPSDLEPDEIAPLQPPATHPSAPASPRTSAPRHASASASPSPSASAFPRHTPPYHGHQYTGKNKKKKKKKTPAVQIHCKVCDKTLTGEAVYNDHIKGRQHCAKLRQFEMRQENAKIRGHSITKPPATSSAAAPTPPSSSRPTHPPSSAPSPQTHRAPSSALPPPPSNPPPQTQLPSSSFSFHPVTSATHGPTHAALPRQTPVAPEVDPYDFSPLPTPAPSPPLPSVHPPATDVAPPPPPSEPASSAQPSPPVRPVIPSPTHHAQPREPFRAQTSAPSPSHPVTSPSTRSQPAPANSPTSKPKRPSVFVMKRPAPTPFVQWKRSTSKSTLPSTGVAKRASSFVTSPPPPTTAAATRASHLQLSTGPSGTEISAPKLVGVGRASSDTPAAKSANPIPPSKLTQKHGGSTALTNPYPAYAATPTPVLGGFGSTNHDSDSKTTPLTSVPRLDHTGASHSAARNSSDLPQVAGLQVKDASTTAKRTPTVPLSTANLTNGMHKVPDEHVPVPTSYPVSTNAPSTKDGIIPSKRPRPESTTGKDAQYGLLDTPVSPSGSGADVDNRSPPRDSAIRRKLAHSGMQLDVSAALSSSPVPTPPNGTKTSNMPGSSTPPTLPLSRPANTQLPSDLRQTGTPPAAAQLRQPSTPVSTPHSVTSSAMPGLRSSLPPHLSLRSKPVDKVVSLQPGGASTDRTGFNSKPVSSNNANTARHTPPAAGGPAASRYGASRGLEGRSTGYANGARGAVGQVAGHASGIALGHTMDGDDARDPAHMQRPELPDPPGSVRVPESFKNEPMSLSEWRELRHKAFSKGDAVDQLAFKILQEVILSPVLGIRSSALKPLSDALVKNPSLHFFFPEHQAAHARFPDFPSEFLDEGRAKEGGYGGETPEQLALLLTIDNIVYTFKTFQDHEVSKSGTHPGELPWRGDFGPKSVKKGPEDEKGQKARYALANDLLYNRIFRNELAKYREHNKLPD